MISLWLKSLLEFYLICRNILQNNITKLSMSITLYTLSKDSCHFNRKENERAM